MGTVYKKMAIDQSLQQLGDTLFLLDKIEGEALVTEACKKIQAGREDLMKLEMALSDKLEESR